MSRAKKGSALLLLLACAIALVIIVVSKANTKNIDVNDVSGNDISGNNMTVVAPQGNYITETVYTGENDVPSVLYDYPFDTTPTDGYISNKELHEDSRKDNYYAYIIRTAQAYVDAYWNNNYRDVLNDQDGFKQSILNITEDNFWGYSDGKETNGYFTEDIANELLSVYLDGEATVSSEFITDESLIFYDGAEYKIRGLLNYSIKAGTIAESKFVPFSGNSGDKGSLIIDIWVSRNDELQKAWNYEVIADVSEIE